MTEKSRPQNRTYGHGSSGELASQVESRKFSLRAKIRYRFDASITKGDSSFVFWIALIGIIAAALVSLLNAAINGASKDGLLGGLRSAWWTYSNTILFHNNLPAGTLGTRIVGALTWMGDIAFASIVIAFVTARLNEQILRLRAGKSDVVEVGHTLILGWSNRIFPILQQLAIANENVRNPVIVIVSSQTRDFMEDEIDTRIPKLGKTKVILRSADPTNPRNLSTANIEGASSIIVLDADTSGDAGIISTVLAIKAAAPDSAHIVAEIDNPSHAQALSEATNGRVLAVQSNDVIARVTAQASRQPGLAAVVLDLLDFEGDEIYFSEVKELVGSTYRQALLAFNTSSIIGVRTVQGEVLINPDSERKFGRGDQVIAIAADDDKVTFTGLRTNELFKKPAVRRTVIKHKAEHLLIIGWSAMGNAVLEELAPFLPTGSTVTILADTSLVAKSALPRKKVGRVSVNFKHSNESITELADAARKKKYFEVIVMAYRENISVAEADARTMLTMLLMNKLFEEDGNGIDPTRLVAEVLDSRKADLARVANPDDLVVSDILSALMATQLSQNPELAPVFTDLFDADGATLCVRPIENYAPVAGQITYATLVASAAARGESAIGYRRAKHPKGDPTSGVILNPEKSAVFATQPGDALVVVGDLF